MSKKQQVFEKYKKLYFEFAELCNIEQPLQKEYDISFYLTHSAKDMLCLIDKLERNIKRQKEQNIIDEWLKTEEGAKWYNEKKNRRDEIVKILSNSVDELKNTIRPLIIGTLGDEWEITSICYTQLTISIMEIEDDDTTPTEKFGHHFELTWHNNRRYDEIEQNDDFCLSFNYGCMGSFKIEENSSRIKLITGMSKLLTDKPLIDKLTNIIRDFYDKTERLHDEKWELFEEMKKPPLPEM